MKFDVFMDALQSASNLPSLGNSSLGNWLVELLGAPSSYEIVALLEEFNTLPFKEVAESFSCQTSEEGVLERVREKIAEAVQNEVFDNQKFRQTHLEVYKYNVDVVAKKWMDRGRLRRQDLGPELKKSRKLISDEELLCVNAIHKRLLEEITTRETMQFLSEAAHLRDDASDIDQYSWNDKHRELSHEILETLTKYWASHVDIYNLENEKYLQTESRISAAKEGSVKFEEAIKPHLLTKRQQRVLNCFLEFPGKYFPPFFGEDLLETAYREGGANIRTKIVKAMVKALKGSNGQPLDPHRVKSEQRLVAFLEIDMQSSGPLNYGLISRLADVAADSVIVTLFAKLTLNSLLQQSGLQDEVDALLLQIRKDNDTKGDHSPQGEVLLERSFFPTKGLSGRSEIQPQVPQGYYLNAQSLAAASLRKVAWVNLKGCGRIGFT